MQRHPRRGVDAGVVDHRVEPTERRRGSVDDAPRALDLRHVAERDDGGAARGDDLVDGALRALAVAAPDGHRRALAREAIRDLAADAARRAGDERAGSLQPAHQEPPSTSMAG